MSSQDKEIKRISEYPCDTCPLSNYNISMHGFAGLNVNGPRFCSFTYDESTPIKCAVRMEEMIDKAFVEMNIKLEMAENDA